MGLIPEQSFTVRTPAWWDNKREYVLQDYPGREEAMEIAGHNWDVVELPSFTAIPAEIMADVDGLKTEAGFTRHGNGWLRQDDGFKSHVRSDNLFLLHKSRDSFERIQNSVAYDVAEVLFEQGFVYETAGTMDGGRLNYLTLLLNNPIIIGGIEGTRALPYGSLAWAHDGSASLKARTGTIVQVCENTIHASEMEGKRLGTSFTFRHTKNVMERIEDAKQAMQGIAQERDAYIEKMEELLALPVTPDQRDLFVSEIIGDRGGVISTSEAASSRVKVNIEKERAKINALFFGPTIPEGTADTGYGLFQAGVEYFDHLRTYRSQDSYVKRTLLSNNPAKANLTKTIREVVAA